MLNGKIEEKKTVKIWHLYQNHLHVLLGKYNSLSLSLTVLCRLEQAFEIYSMFNIPGDLKGYRVKHVL